MKPFILMTRERGDQRLMIQLRILLSPNGSAARCTSRAMNSRWQAHFSGGQGSLAPGSVSLRYTLGCSSLATGFKFQNAPVSLHRNFSILAINNSGTSMSVHQETPRTNSMSKSVNIPETQEISENVWAPDVKIKNLLSPEWL